MEAVRPRQSNDGGSSTPSSTSRSRHDLAVATGISAGPASPASSLPSTNTPSPQHPSLHRPAIPTVGLAAPGWASPVGAGLPVSPAYVQYVPAGPAQHAHALSHASSAGGFVSMAPHAQAQAQTGQWHGHGQGQGQGQQYAPMLMQGQAGMPVGYPMAYPYPAGAVMAHAGQPLAHAASGGSPGSLSSTGSGQAGVASPLPWQVAAAGQPLVQVQGQARAVVDMTAVAVPRPLPSAAYPLTTTTLRLHGIATAQQLHTVTCRALKDAGIDFDYSAAKFKAHCFGYGLEGGGQCYFIVRCYAAPPGGGSGGAGASGSPAGPAAAGAGQGSLRGTSSGSGQTQGQGQGQDYAIEFQRQRGDPLAFLDMYEAAQASLKQQGMAVGHWAGGGGGGGGDGGEGGGDGRRSKGEPGTFGGLQASLIEQDNAEYEREEKARASDASGAGEAGGHGGGAAAAAAEPAAAGGTSSSLKGLFDPKPFAGTLASLLAAINSPLADEEGVSAMMWAVASMTRSLRFLGTVGRALSTIYEPSVLQGQDRARYAEAAATCDALMRTLVGRACAPAVPGLSPSATINSRTGAALALAGMAANPHIATALCQGQAQGCPTLQAMLVTAEMLPVQADCVRARRELVRAAAACHGHPGLAAAVAAAAAVPEVAARLQRLKAGARTTGDAKLLEALSRMAGPA